MLGADMTALIAEQHRQDLRRQAEQARLALTARTPARSIKHERHARPAKDRQGVLRWALTRWTDAVQSMLLRGRTP